MMVHMQVRKIWPQLVTFALAFVFTYVNCCPFIVFLIALECLNVSKRFYSVRLV